MHPWQAFPPIRYLAGYLLSVVVAALVAALAISMTEIQNALRAFAGLAAMAGFYALFSAWPGFVATTWLARALTWRHPAIFALAGGLNALAALLLVGMLEPGSGAWLLSDFGTASVAGGLAGGLAYGRFATATSPAR